MDYIYIYIDIYIYRERERETDRQTDRQRQRERETDRKRDTDRKREERERERDWGAEKNWPNFPPADIGVGTGGWFSLTPPTPHPSAHVLFQKKDIKYVIKIETDIALLV